MTAKRNLSPALRDVTAQQTVTIRQDWVAQFEGAAADCDVMWDRLAPSAEVRIAYSLENSPFAGVLGAMDVSTPRAYEEVHTLELDDVLRDASRVPAITDAPLYWLSEDVVPLVDQAAGNLDPADRWDSSLMPTLSGFCVFEQGVGADVPGAGTIRVAQWQPATHFLDDDTVNGDFVRGTLFSFWSEDGNPGDDDLVWPVTRRRDRKVLRPRFTLFVAHGAPLGSLVAPTRLLDTDTIGDFEHLTDMNLSRWMLGMFLVMTEPTSQVVLTEGDGAEFDYAPPAFISVVSLRPEPTAPSAGVGGSVDWDCRWKVREHIRRQPVGPNYVGAIDNGDGSYHVMKRITSYDKGPESKDFKDEPHTVYAVRA